MDDRGYALPVRARLLLAIPALACSGTSAGSASSVGATPAEVLRLCDAQCQRQERCDPQDVDPQCVASCTGKLDHPENLRSDFLTRLASCTASLPCERKDDDCTDEAVRAIDPNAESNPLLLRCQAIQDECGGFSDDACVGAVFFTDAARQALADCLERPCEAVGACVQALI